nr:hypothetical protein [Lachnospiraceae bacterium]
VETMKAIKAMENYDGTPIYVLTANAITGAKEQYMSEGFDGYLSKPIIYDKLEQAIIDELPKEKVMRVEGSVRVKDVKRAELPIIDGVDWEIARLHLPDDDILEITVKDFYLSIKSSADKLDRMLDDIYKSPDDKDAFDEYRITVHAMKSVALTIGIVPLSGMAKILEGFSRETNLDGIISLHPIFINEWRSYEDKLRGLFDLGLEDEEDKEHADSEMLRAIFSMLIPAMEDFDIDEADMIAEKLKSYSYTPEIDPIIVELYAAIRDMDLDTSKDIIARIEEML